MIVPAAYSRFDRNADRRGAAGLRLCLRSVTAAAHNRLDARFRSLDLTGVAGYRQFLEANAAALLPLEAALVHARVGRIVPDWPARSRQAAILDDLARTGGKMEPLPLPDPLDFGGVLGTMYVLESSRLGATALLNLVQRSNEPTVLCATAYLRHGAGHDFWQSFLTALESHPATLHESGAIDGAVRAFEMFEQAAARALRPAAQTAST